MKEEEHESVLTEEVEQPGRIEYTPDEALYLSGIATRLRDAKQDRDKIHPEFNNKSFIDHYTENERIANTFVAGKKFDGDVQIASGTVEQKMYAVLAEINRLRLSPEILAFDERDTQLISLGQAMTDVVMMTQKNDEGEEGKLLRQIELLKQGTVFIQEMWSREYKKEKKFKGKIGSFDASWTTMLKLAYEGPRRRVLYAPGVYLGNVRTAGPMREQPFIFTHKITTMSDVESRFGMKKADGTDAWDRWKFVPRTRVNGISTELMDNPSSAVLINDAWALTDVPEGKCEEIHYEDRFNNEFQIFLNGVPMLPLGFPLSAVSPGGEYTVEKQVFQFINPFFAYGRSFTAKVHEQSDILDELLRLLIIKTRKSIHPPYANRGNRVISSKVLMPGRITMGIDAQSLQPIGVEGQGATASEYQMYKTLSDKLDENTVSRQFSGQQGKSGTTAFEVATLQKQAEKVLGLTIFACTMLEMKLGYQRNFNLLENHFEPTGSAFDDARNLIIDKYRITTTRNVPLGAEGTGIRQVVPSQNPPMPGQLREEEVASARNSRPLKKIYINPEGLKKARITWYVDVDTEPRETSNVKKLLFREELTDIMALTQLGSRPNVEELERQHAIIWNRQKDKLFSGGMPPPSPAGSSQPGQQSKSPGGPGGAMPPNTAELIAE